MNETLNCSHKSVVCCVASHDAVRGLMEAQEEEVTEEGIQYVAMRNLFVREAKEAMHVRVEKKTRSTHVRESAERMAMSKTVNPFHSFMDPISNNPIFHMKHIKLIHLSDSLGSLSSCSWTPGWSSVGKWTQTTWHTVQSSSSSPVDRLSGRARLSSCTAPWLDGLNPGLPGEISPKLTGPHPSWVIRKKKLMQSAFACHRKASISCHLVKYIFHIATWAQTGAHTLQFEGPMLCSFGCWLENVFMLLLKKNKHLIFIILSIAAAPLFSLCLSTPF